MTSKPQVIQMSARRRVLLYLVGSGAGAAYWGVLMAVPRLQEPTAVWQSTVAVAYFVFIGAIEGLVAAFVADRAAMITAIRGWTGRWWLAVTSSFLGSIAIQIIFLALQAGYSPFFLSVSFSIFVGSLVVLALRPGPVGSKETPGLDRLPNRFGVPFTVALVAGTIGAAAVIAFGFVGTAMTLTFPVQAWAFLSGGELSSLIVSACWILASPLLVGFALRIESRARRVSPTEAVLTSIGWVMVQTLWFQSVAKEAMRPHVAAVDVSSLIPSTLALEIIGWLVVVGGSVLAIRAKRSKEEPFD
jgi:hypothetical protein